MASNDYVEMVGNGSLLKRAEIKTARMTRIVRIDNGVCVVFSTGLDREVGGGRKIGRGEVEMRRERSSVLTLISVVRGGMRKTRDSCQVLRVGDLQERGNVLMIYVSKVEV